MTSRLTRKIPANPFKNAAPEINQTGILFEK